jgi:hypothetical protein
MMNQIPQPNTVSNEFASRSAWKAGVLGTVNAFAVILAVRMTLLVSICGAIALALLVLEQPDPLKVASLGIYALVVVVPMVWLAARR